MLFRSNAVHGSVYFKALDDAAFFAANSLNEEFFVLTSNYSITFIRPMTEGSMTATGQIVHSGRRMMSAESRLTDGQGVLIAHGTGTFMTSAVPLREVPGYG